MKDKRLVSSVFGTLSALLMVGAVCLSICGGFAVPYVLDAQNSVVNTVCEMLTAVQTGDIGKVSESFVPGTDFGKILSLDEEIIAGFYRNAWPIMTFSIDGEPYESESTVALDVEITCVNTGVTAQSIQDGVRELWHQRSNDETSMQDVVNRAMAEAMNAAPTLTEEVTVHLVQVDGCWKIIPENGLVNALSGWVLQ